MRRLFYSATPVALLLLFAIHARSEDTCFPPDSEFARVECECHYDLLICEKRGQLSEFPTLNVTFPIVEEM